ncbi:hypothetical protein EYF80_025234 [Liparis tanakae]|uniref:Uncharacterized protein n=1 Tax=Liparis tanakae TaxID=230148 RepID=A0A4Z2HFF9_9TELE|nr:hypothetical protein EYF80_025234 [Liparis tanakae]
MNTEKPPHARNQADGRHNKKGVSSQVGSNPNTRTPTARRPHAGRTPAARRPHADRTPAARRPNADRTPTAQRPHADRTHADRTPLFEEEPPPREVLISSTLWITDCGAQHICSKSPGQRVPPWLQMIDGHNYRSKHEGELFMNGEEI